MEIQYGCRHIRSLYGFTLKPAVEERDRPAVGGVLSLEYREKLAAADQSSGTRVQRHAESTQAKLHAKVRTGKVISSVENRKKILKRFNIFNFPHKKNSNSRAMDGTRFGPKNIRRS